MLEIAELKEVQKCRKNTKMHRKCKNAEKAQKCIERCKNAEK
jgi:hypothetical protein